MTPTERIEALKNAMHGATSTEVKKAWDAVRAENDRAALPKLTIGTEVRFSARGDVWVGTVESFGRTKVKVRATLRSGRNLVSPVLWNCPPSMLVPTTKVLGTVVVPATKGGA
jgi:hypothetical protein